MKTCSNCKYYMTPLNAEPCTNCLFNGDFTYWTSNDPTDGTDTMDERTVIMDKIIARLEKHIMLSSKEAIEIVRKEMTR